MMEILDQIAKELPKLSPKLAIAARFVLDHPEKIALNSMRSVTASCGITTPTMLRLARHVGFENYESFKAQFQDSLVQQGFGSRAGALRNTQIAQGSEVVVEQLFGAALQNISDTANTLDLTALRQMAKLMCGAEKNYIVGSGSMYWVASIFAATGRMALPNLNVAGAGEAPCIEMLSDVSENDVVLAFALSPYAKGTISAIELAGEAGAKVITVTDKRSSPLVPLSSHTVFAKATSPHYYPSIVSFLAIIEALLALVVANSDQNMTKRIKHHETMRKKSGAYQF